MLQRARVQLFAAVAIAWSVTAQAGAGVSVHFRRGDSNADGQVDISDPVYSLGVLFQGSGQFSCVDAADANDDGTVDISDPISELQYLFQGGSPPPAPGPMTCGPDPTPDALDCLSYPPCPQEGCLSNAECGPDEYCRKEAGNCDGLGECAPRPEACPRIFDPVCGCDGKTYGNACLAAAAGVNVAYEGECEVPCTSNEDCGPDEYCAKEPGDCEGQGVCRPRPEACVMVFDPVCGCDGKTYANACLAAAAGVSIAHEGECEVTEVPCTSNADCGPEEYCSKAPGDCDGEGVCRPRPEVCPDVFDPVCGCDGKTYTNACEAAAAGVSVAYEGECGTPCDSNADCGRNEYCAKPAGECDGQGVCRPRPEVCPDVFAPVCGCDGETYTNACEAAAAGVSVAYEGECKTPCTSNEDCGPDEYCRKNPGDCDGEGVCEPRPDVCPLFFDPVCGCDGKTYANACEAAAAGVSIAHEGECEVVEVPCTSNADCGPEEYCSKAPGDCDGEGVCRPKPEVCPLFFDPVCGCDGKTYTNACEAAAAGVSIAHEGECEVVAIPCTSNADCGPEEYCAKEPGDCDGEGVCEPRLDVCLDVFLPVCGCDGKTYANACEAAAAGVSIAYEGECGTPCNSNRECGRGEYCAKPPGDCNGQGVCRPLPQACPDVLDPVCGCDGETYRNACEAAAAGVSVAYEGPCTRPCDSDLDCGPDEYCRKAAGDCDGQGACQPRPDVCPLVFDPVCGCDGNTYTNACFAAQAGVSIAHEGECEVVAIPCKSNADCGRDEFCSKAPGDCDGEGVCKPRPEACPQVFAPVCGCDGETYANACEAAAAGVSIAYEGECQAAETPCTSNEDCGPGEYCHKDPGNCDGEGVCRPRPEVCVHVYAPVCGCDGKTYTNACFAAAAGVSVAYEGECEVVEIPCTANADCGPDEYCRKEPGDCDGEGVCEPKPDACIQVFDPVCGCDGKTYVNACFAAAAGVNVRHAGACIPDLLGNQPPPPPAAAK